MRRAGPVERTIFASRRFVLEKGYIPKSETDDKPSTLYGESKIRGEELVRQARESFGPWAIVRPASIWGPWFGLPVPYKRIFTLIADDRCAHPGHHNPRKSYCYVEYGQVENTVFQLEKIVEAAVEEVNMITEIVYDTSELESIVGLLPFSTRDGVAQHHAHLPQPTALHEVFVGGAHRITVEALGPNLLAVASLQRLIDAEDEWALPYERL